MRQSRRTTLVAALLLAALTPGIALAQIDTKKKTDIPRIGPSTTSKTELRPKTITLRLAQFDTFSSTRVKEKNSDPRTTSGPQSNYLFAGYLHDTNGTLPGDPYAHVDWRNEFYRGALRFHTTKLLHHKILKATLNLRIYKTHIRGIHSANDHYTQVATCAKTLQSGKTPWWSSPGDTIDIGPPTAAVEPSGTSDLHIDVTGIVSQWSEPHSNFGLVLVGENEDLGAYTETICQTQFVHAGQGAPTLKVVYQ